MTCIVLVSIIVSVLRILEDEEIWQVMFLAKILMSRWGGVIKMKSVFENGKLRHYAVCEKSGNTARKAKDLM